MPEPTGADPAKVRAERERRLAAVFGDVLPETTRDERDDGSGEAAANDRWLRDQVPPHHG